jgi:flagellar hook-basal body complex protein FliE
MTISQLQRLQSAYIEGTDRHRDLPNPRGAGAAQGSDPTGFGETLRQAIDQVDSLQKEADDQITRFVSGEQENVHEVMIAMNQASLSFQLMTEVRNKMIETYQELIRMQV